MKSALKEEVLRLVEQLPDDATWEDLQYAIYVREKIERGLADAAAGQVKTSEEIRAYFREKFQQP